MNIALISGTSGMVGMQLLHQLLKKYDFVISVGRRKLALKHEKLVQLEGDLLKINIWDWEHLLMSSSLGGEYQLVREEIFEKKAEIHAFSSLGTTIKQAGSKERFYQIDHDMVLEFATWAKNLGASKFLYVSSLSADPESSVFYSKVKGEVEQDLQKLDYSFLGIFRPSLLLGNRNEFRLGEWFATIAMKPLVWLKVLKNYRPIHDFQVAKAMVFVANQASSKNVEIINSGQMQDLTK
ncbi:NAD-dependent epimerase/dehydratase family protein [Algoriphagus lutimaris]|uniref:NAD-dependent epimerase/dehydratase family protein n=1 Tax=Algoriphagus lutimaris TaxID=613197 RepID=UPI00196B48C0|nr:NAD-dependent epimerase/dehydratase family protein [Algoriphagus lutimaris]MBN3519894.1 NAD-dependent epimerase/dehydratase family protein [Algoriphagus lutimaris]